MIHINELLGCRSLVSVLDDVPGTLAHVGRLSLQNALEEKCFAPHPLPRSSAKPHPTTLTNTFSAIIG